ARRAADEGIATFIEPEHPVRFLGDADADAGGDLGFVPTGFAEPQRIAGEEIDAVEAGIDAEGGGEPAGTAGEVAWPVGTAAACHQADAVERLDGAQQGARPDAGLLARDVEGEPAAIDEIDIGVAAVEKERAVAARLTAEGMAARIADDIGLGLDDAAAGSALLAVMNQDAADQVARQRHRLGWELLATKRARRRTDGKRLVN